MFKRKKNTVGQLPDKAAAIHAITPALVTEIVARYASLFMICYRRRDISGMHVTFTALTHSLHALQCWANKTDLAAQCLHYILLDGFPELEKPALQWLINHYFEQINDADESCLLNWYQSIDDEWVLRKKLREMFPDKLNSELTVLIAEEQGRRD
jgi:hypothetical protein